MLKGMMTIVEFLKLKDMHHNVIVIQMLDVTSQVSNTYLPIDCGSEYVHPKPGI
jgi:hypothetical protein